MSKESEHSDETVVDLARARVRLRSGTAKNSSASPSKELEAISLLLDKGHSVEARTRLVSLITAARKDPALLARARLALSLALEMHGEYQESLQAIAMYEPEEERAKLDSSLAVRLRVQTSIAYNYSGDHPKAITLLKTALRDFEEQAANPDAGTVYAALARVYRSINEYPIARDYSQRALDIYRQSGDWRGLAEAYFGIAVADHAEGENESALENFEQALQLIGDHPATFLLGKIYSNMASACRWLKRPQEGVRYLEKAIGYYERTEHKNLAADGHNNLGVNLILVGQWDRAQEAFERALALAGEVDERADRVSMFLDSLGELCMLRGDLDEARGYLERAVAMATEKGNKWYACQAWRTLARCHIAMNANDKALTAAQEALDLAGKIGNRQATCESKLLLAEGYLESGDLDSCASALQEAEQTLDSADMVLAGEVQRLHGLLALAGSDASTAAQHFGRCVSIFDLLGDRYRSARSHYDLGRAYALAQPEHAAEHLSRAANVFRELGARLDLAAAEAALAEHNQTVPQQQRQREAVLQLVTLRLAEAVASRALLLRELAAVIRQETPAKCVVILEPDDEQRTSVVVAQGCDSTEASAIADRVSRLETDSDRERFSRKYDAALIELRSSNALPATLLISPRDAAQLAGGLPLEPLLRIVELGMDVCALRARALICNSLLRIALFIRLCPAALSAQCTRTSPTPM
ncbi:MAG: tetratricopeptide repeat protein [Acidobacteriota bacterium]